MEEPTQRLEVYLLILKALEGSPYKDVAKSLFDELQKNIASTRSDFQGVEHSADLNSLLAKYPNINSKTLEQMCERLKEHLNGHFPPSIQGIDTYLGAGQFSMLRTSESLRLDSIQHAVKSLLSDRLYGPAYQNQSVNFVRHLQARRLIGSTSIRRTCPTEIYSRVRLYKKIMGHLSSVYCVCFDQTGQYIFTGADDHLIKIWSARDGRLLKTLRGHDGEITDMSVNFENRLLASGGMDRVVRIWDLKTSKLLDCLNTHSAMVTSVKFSPYNRHGDNRYLVSTSNDGSVIFWVYHKDKFEFKAVQRFKERNRPGGRIVCSSYSTGGSFLACGSSDNYIHVYGFHPCSGPYWISELDNHRDQVDSIQFSNHGYRFITGSIDGTAIIWSYKAGEWRPMKLDMNTQLDQSVLEPAADQPKPKVLIVQWSRDDRYVMTSIADYSIKVWDSKTGRLVKILKEHTHDVYLIESHPMDPRIFISASHDGSIVVWDIERGKIIKKFINKAEPAEVIDPDRLASIYDIKFSPDGDMFAATDSYGCLSLYGYGNDDPYRELPEQMFFHTDYRALIRDMRNFVLDDQTHVAPHLMPRPTLVDMNGDPYPEPLQRLVPDYQSGERIVIAPLNDDKVRSLSEHLANHSRQEDEEYLDEKRSPPDDLMRNAGPSTSLNSISPRANNHRSNQSGDRSRYNTRYSTRFSFISARSNFMPQHSRSRREVRVSYRFDEDDEDEEDRIRPYRDYFNRLGSQRRQLQRQSGRLPQARPQAQRQQQQQQREVQNERPRRQVQRRLPEDTHSESETEEEEDEETEIETETEEEESDDETVIDSDATEIDETLQRTPRQPARLTRSAVARSMRGEPEEPNRRCSARLRARKRLRRS